MAIITPITDIINDWNNVLKTRYCVETPCAFKTPKLGNFWTVRIYKKIEITIRIIIYKKPIMKLNVSCCALYPGNLLINEPMLNWLVPFGIFELFNVFLNTTAFVTPLFSDWIVSGEI